MLIVLVITFAGHFAMMAGPFATLETCSGFNNVMRHVIADSVRDPIVFGSMNIRCFKREPGKDT